MTPCALAGRQLGSATADVATQNIMLRGQIVYARLPQTIQSLLVEWTASLEEFSYTFPLS